MRWIDLNRLWLRGEYLIESVAHGRTTIRAVAPICAFMNPPEARPEPTTVTYVTL